MSEAPWRCFVAVPLPDDLRAGLAATVTGWRSRFDLEGLRWVEPAGWHVTLAFLGQTDPARVPAIAAAVAAIAAGHTPWVATTGGVGAFPSPSRARVAWYGVSDRDGRLSTLAGDLRAALAIDDAGPFRPHVTLGRTGRQRVDLRAWVAGASAPAGRLAVERIELMRSHVGGGPARYETLATSTLGVPSRA
jgi:2'-5' RNA ligase